MPPTRWAAVSVDGKPKMLERDLAAALSAAGCGEPGVSISGDLAESSLESHMRTANRSELLFSHSRVAPERLS
jgi:hypothetical protein